MTDTSNAVEGRHEELIDVLNRINESLDTIAGRLYRIGTTPGDRSWLEVTTQLGKA